MHTSHTWISQLNYAVGILGTPAGIAVALLVLSMFLASFSRRGRWAVLTVMLYCATYSFNTNRIVPLISPLEQIRYLSEVLTALFLIFLIAPAAFGRYSHLSSPLLWGAVLFWVLEVFYSLRVTGAVTPAKAGIAVCIFTALLLVLAYGLPGWLTSVGDVFVISRCLGMASVLVILGIAAQLLINRSAALAGDRLVGTTGNPQYAAMVLSIGAQPLYMLLASRREGPIRRIIWGIFAAAGTTLLMSTGSRTGMLVLIVGLAIMFWRRSFRFVLMIIVIGFLIMLFQWLFSIGGEASARLLNTMDTRSGGWKAYIELFLDHPLLGHVEDLDFGVVENSYLTVAARTGVVGLSVLGLAMMFIFFSILQLRRTKALVSKDQGYAIDFVSAGIVSILAGAIFEGILVGTLTFMLLSLYIYLGLLKYLTDPNTLQQLKQNGAEDSFGFPSVGADESIAANDVGFDNSFAPGHGI